jgi:ElaB/YqjD/DUF883 family membrane-anchored ribosome-binding protein
MGFLISPRELARESSSSLFHKQWNLRLRERVGGTKETPMDTQQNTRSSSSSGGASVAGTAADMRAKAGEAVSKLTDVAQQAGSQARQTASSLAADANQKATGFLNQRIAGGADLAAHVADSAKCAADNLDDKAPQLAELVRGVADKVEEFSEEIRGKSVDELLRSASDYTRRRPAVVFGLASLAGFLLFRVIKANPGSATEITGTRDLRVGHGTGEFHG